VDLRSADHWGRRPLAKIVCFSATGVVLAARLSVDGDGRVLLASGAMAVLMPVSIAGAIGQMRGTVSPLPGRSWRLVSPLAGIAWSTAMLLLSVIVPLDIWLTRGDPSPWLNGGWSVAGALLVAGVCIQIGSLSDQWPDKWRPPYARQRPADAPAAAADPDDGPADRSPDRA
jgi:hypothetical protein